jgi:GT2 family glycosyltransferase
MKRKLVKKLRSVMTQETPQEHQWGLSDYELECDSATDQSIDILMVVRGQLPYVKHCVESIKQNTPSFHLYLWDNGSDDVTASYLRLLADEDNVTLHREEENKGFIIPNNRLAELGNNPYIVLLNSDCYVREGWSAVMTGWLKNHPEYAQVGYMGGYLDEKGQGVRGGFGSGVDYVCGHCFCISREFYEEFGLFDEENLTFAYCEDSDFSMRIREAERRIYALHLDLVVHYGNKTAIPVLQENTDVRGYIAANHAYLRKRWAKFLPV